MTVYTLGVWHVRPGSEEQFVRAWDDLARWTVENEYESHGVLMRDRENPSRFVSYGPWPSVEAAAAWRAADGFRERIAAIEELLERFEPGLYDVVLRVG